jgi:4-methylaminobutanoate oxidase (formaldehyde-forming)
VIIGGGVGGTSIAYHLTELGWRDVILVDRAELTSGSTFHSAGLVGQLRSSVTLTKMMMYGRLYRRLAAETGSTSWHEVGSRPASSRERPRGAAALPWDRLGLPERLDLTRTRAVATVRPDWRQGAAYLPTDGYLDLTNLPTAGRARSIEVWCPTQPGSSGSTLRSYVTRPVRRGRPRQTEVVVNAGGMSRTSSSGWPASRCRSCPSRTSTC